MITEKNIYDKISDQIVAAEFGRIGGPARRWKIMRTEYRDEAISFVVTTSEGGITYCYTLESAAEAYNLFVV